MLLEYRKAVAYSTILHPTFPSCAAHMPYFIWHGIKYLCNAFDWYTMEWSLNWCAHQPLRLGGCAFISDKWDILWNPTQKHCLTCMYLSDFCNSDGNQIESSTSFLSPWIIFCLSGDVLIDFSFQLASV